MKEINSEIDCFGCYFKERTNETSPAWCGKDGQLISLKDSCDTGPMTMLPNDVYELGAYISKGKLRVKALTEEFGFFS